MATVDDILLEMDEKMSKSYDFLIEQFSGLRTGKADPALVENVTVEYYGAPTRLKELAGISTPEPRLIVISAYDPTILSEVEKAILAANLGVTPMNDGRVIRIPIPELTEERRTDMVKVGKRMAEECRVAIRNERRQGNENIKGIQKQGQISEDDRDEALKNIQKETDAFIEKVDKVLKDKESEIMEV